MPTVATSILDANLDALGERNADVVERIRAATPPPTLCFEPTGQEALTATLDGVPLASRRRPLDEAERLAGTVDPAEHAVVVVLGFGLGHHVHALARRIGRAGVVVVFEPDVGLLRAVLERIDHSGWIRDCLLVLVNDAGDRAALGTKLGGAEAILAQGIAFLEHPPSRKRLGTKSAAFSTLLTEYVTTAKTTLVTTLVRSIDTIRNLLLNVDHYVGGPGVADLAGAATGRLAIVVSAGPSLHRNLSLLTAPGVRDRCVIIAVQTTLKPLLDAGVKPHFVTALDYHEISRRFYEGLTPEDVEGVTLVVDPKAHPAIIDAFPGCVRCCAEPYLDRLLGDLKRDMGTMPGGATVAHLALYLARFLGCDPIALIGQDLGFPDGLYYAPGTAIHDVWAPELNPFNTIAMMEWQRIARHRVHLHKTVDVNGRSIYTDAQMLTYLQQFERDFAEYERDGATIIDATEGGVAKQHTTVRTLAEVLAAHATESIRPLPLPDTTPDRTRLAAAARRLDGLAREVVELRTISRRTRGLLGKMLDDQNDAARMERLFARIERERQEVERRFEAFGLLNHLNQLGVFKRMRADRRLHWAQELGPVERQRAQLDRDLENVTWIADAAGEMTARLADARNLLRGRAVAARPRPARVTVEGTDRGAPAAAIDAIVPVDPARNGRGVERSLDATIAGRGILQRTLERLDRVPGIGATVLLVPEDFDVAPMVDGAEVRRPIVIERTPGSPFGPEQRAVAVARLWAETCWRGGIAGMSAYDEVLCPGPMHAVMTRRGLAAALLCGPDWPLVSPSDDTGCGAVAARFREHPDHHGIVFTQAPPGLSGCIVSTGLMGELTQRTRLSTIGGLLVYQPHAPQPDPVATDANVQIDADLRRALVRMTADTPRGLALLEHALEGRDPDDLDPRALIADLERAEQDLAPERLPRELVLELTGPGAGHGPHLADSAVVEAALAAFGAAGDAVVTFRGATDPAAHPDLGRFVKLAADAGLRAVHVRTDLAGRPDALERLVAAGPDVISVDLHADRAATYERMHGRDGFRAALDAIEHLAGHRRHLAGPPGTAGFSLPWIVPRIVRGPETHEDLDSFYDRWQHILGAAVIDHPASDAAAPPDWTPAVTPDHVAKRWSLRRMTVRADGGIPFDDQDPRDARTAGAIPVDGFSEVWRRIARRRAGLPHPGAPSGTAIEE